MASRKLDGIIEAVRYCADGNIDLVRVYERRGAVWSDHVLMERKILVKQLNNGDHFVIGERKDLLGGVFNTGSEIQQIKGAIITEGQATTHDLLAGVPVF